jgi:predicted nucleotidyltransferase
MVASNHIVNKLHENLPTKYKNNIMSLLTAILNSEQLHLISQIYLFGSCARNEIRQDSDIDLCIILPSEQDIKNDIHICLDVERNLDRFKAPVFEYDLKFGTEQDMYHAYPYLIYHDVKNEGVLLYEPQERLL